MRSRYLESERGPHQALRYYAFAHDGEKPTLECYAPGRHRQAGQLYRFQSRIARDRWVAGKDNNETPDAPTGTREKIYRALFPVDWQPYRAIDV